MVTRNSNRLLAVHMWCRH